jgi:hypothetical protein
MTLTDPFTATTTDTTSSRQPIPPFLAGRALKSMRDAGFDLPTALGEVIDNGLEADANTVVVDMREVPVDRKRKAVDRIAITDDGTGMTEDVLHRYLQVGYSTRYMRTDTIGKYGVGGTTAALNFATRIDVWSRDTRNGPVRHVYLDLDEAVAAEETGETVVIAPPDTAPLPADLAESFPAGTGTMVVWSKIDRLADGTGAHTPGELRSEVEKELSRIFRDFLHGGITIEIRHRGEATKLLPHDPTYRMEGSWADHVISREITRLAGDGGTDADGQIGHFAAKVVYDDDIDVAGSKVRLAITVYPDEVVRERGKGGDAFARKLRIRENQGKISFMRRGREISYTNVPNIFGSAVKEADRFIGIEVRFEPELDRMMGVRNVKRGAEPSAELRQALRDVLIPQMKQARSLVQDRWRQTGRDNRQSEGEHAPINTAVGEVNRNLPKSRVEVSTDDVDVEQALDDLAHDVGKTEPAEARAYIERVRRLPFVVESVDWPGDQLFEIVHAGKTTIIRLNKRHRFYREMYTPIRNLSQQDPDTVIGEDAVAVARRAAEAITLLFIAYAKAESMHENPDEQYNELRGWWGNFTNYLLGKVKDVLD